MDAVTSALEAFQRRRQPRGIDMTGDGARIAFAASYTCSSQPQGAPPSRIWLTRPGGSAHELTDGPAIDTLPRWSPDGRVLAVASDRDHPGHTSIFRVDPDSGETALVAETPGPVEDLRWSADGKGLMALIANAADDDPGPGGNVPDGADPMVTRPGHAWRRLYHVDVASGFSTAIDLGHLTVWEFDWDGAGELVALLSADPSEGGWYSPFLASVDLRSGEATTLYVPRWQLTCPRLSPGGYVAVVEGLASDRGNVVGTMTVLYRGDERPRRLVPEVDVSWLQWRDASSLWYAAKRGLGSACGRIGIDGRVDELWSGAATLTGRPVLLADPTGRWLVSTVEDCGMHLRSRSWRLSSATRAGSRCHR